jgi:hypothetical protein
MPGVETGLLIGGSSLVTLIIGKLRCFYKHASEHPCACGFTDHGIQDDNEVHVKTTTINGVELLYVGKKHAEDDDDEVYETPSMKFRNCSHCPYDVYYN